MKVSLNTVKQLTGIDLPPVDELVAKINAQLGGVEEVIDLGTRYKDAKIVKVVECDKHPDADKLSVCMIDAGEDQLVQVVCGAPNARKVMWAVWLPPESIVPSSYDDEKPFKLEAREIRGVLSNGMLASGSELGINNNHDGIVDISESDLLEKIELQAGASFAKIFGLDDTIIDIENKMFTHRPDLFGQLGVAREISAILQPEVAKDESIDNCFENPEWYGEVAEFVSAAGIELKVFNDAPDVVPRLMIVAMQNVELSPSPLWLQTTLMRWGSKAINNVVDLTNYIMLLTSQPTHAYDADKLHDGKIGARLAKKGEKITLLNDKTYELDETDIVIADGERAIGLAGVMGGADTEVDDNTKNIVLECANFDMYSVRRSAMRHGLFTDALTRFNKGQSPLQNDRVMAKLMNLMTELAGAKQASEVFDLSEYSGDRNSLHGELQVGIDFINQRLGIDMTSHQVGNILRSTNFTVHETEDNFAEVSIVAPFWRTDIEIPEDIVEEVGRLYGFDKLPRELPKRSMRPAKVDDLRLAKQSIRNSMSKAGANEVLTYSFVSKSLVDRASQDTDQAFELANAMSPDLQLYRLSVLPSLLDKVHMNIKAGHDEFILYEFGKGHNKKYHLDDDNGLPSEMQFFDTVYASKDKKQGAAFYYMRRLLDQIASDHDLELVYTPAKTDMDYPVTAPFDLKRSAMVHTIGGNFVGMIGELKQSVIRSFKLPQYSAAMTVDIQSFAALIAGAELSYTALSRYPSIRQDVSLQTGADIAYLDLTRSVREALDELSGEMAVNIEPLAIYQPEGDTSVKTTTYRLTAVSDQRTLTDDDLNQVIERLVASVKSTIDINII